jgi:excisionase family DNA binding protein
MEIVMRLSASQLAELWGCSRQHIYALARTGKLRCIRVGDLYRFRPEDVSEYEAAACQNPNPAHQSTNSNSSGGVAASVAGPGSRHHPRLSILRPPAAPRTNWNGTPLDGYQAALRHRAKRAAI